MKKAISIFLSLLLLASSSGVAYAKHFCGGMEMLSIITISAKDLSCGMELVKSHCEDSIHVSEDKDCCENLITQIQTSDDFAKACFDLKFENNFIPDFSPVLEQKDLAILTEKTTYFADYYPPSLVSDLCIFYDSFLI